MAKFNADPFAPSVGSLAARTAATPYPAAPGTAPSGPAPLATNMGSSTANYFRSEINRIRGAVAAGENLLFPAKGK